MQLRSLICCVAHEVPLGSVAASCGACGLQLSLSDEVGIAGVQHANRIRVDLVHERCVLCLGQVQVFPLQVQAVNCCDWEMSRKLVRPYEVMCWLYGQYGRNEALPRATEAVSSLEPAPLEVGKDLLIAGRITEEGSFLVGFLRQESLSNGTDYLLRFSHNSVTIRTPSVVSLTAH